MISGFRLMWLMVMFDLPVETKDNKRDYRRFVDYLEDQGFFRIQYSVFARPCMTEENTLAVCDRVVDNLPPLGEIRILRFTDKQWARMILFWSGRRAPVESRPDQFSFFDDNLQVVAELDQGPSATPSLIPGSTIGSPNRQASRTSAGKLGRKSRKAAPPEPSFDFYD